MDAGVVLHFAGAVTLLVLAAAFVMCTFFVVVAAAFVVCTFFVLVAAVFVVCTYFVVVAAVFVARAVETVSVVAAALVVVAVGRVCPGG